MTVTETLVIRLRSTEDAPASWFIIDGNGARSGSSSTARSPTHSSSRRAAARWSSCPRPKSRSPSPTCRPGGRAHRPGGAVCARGAARLRPREPPSQSVHATRPRAPRRSRSSAQPARSLAGLGRGGHPPRRRLRRIVADPGVAEFHGARARRRHAPREAARRGRLRARRIVARHGLELTLAPSSSEAGEHVTFYVGTADYESNRELVEGLRERTATLQVKLLPDGILPLLAAQPPTAGP